MLTQGIEYNYDAASDLRIRKRLDSNGNGSWNSVERYIYDGEVDMVLALPAEAVTVIANELRLLYRVNQARKLSDRAAMLDRATSLLSQQRRNATSRLDDLVRYADDVPFSTSRRALKGTTGRALTVFDPDFAAQQRLSGLFKGGRTASASELADVARQQGWTLRQTANGPAKYVDGNGVVRITLNRGSVRAPGSAGPHVELRNAQGQRIDPLGLPVSRKSPGNHTPIN